MSQAIGVLLGHQLSGGHHRRARLRRSPQARSVESVDEGRPFAVWEQCPSLWAARRASTSDVTPV
jgi:hypothetical protein